jgi:RNA polymerase sigma-70 factor (ECF subfamily)
MSRYRELTAGCYPVDHVDAEFVMDEDAFRAFYDRTSRGIWAYLARVTNDRQLADDLLQETYYRFLRAKATHDTEIHRKNSLYKIATNLARDAHRRKRTEPVEIGDAPVVEMAAPANYESSAAQRTDLDRAMQRMDPRERAMLWLAYGEGASHSEIAAIMGMRAASLKTVLFRARRRLAALLTGNAQRVTR